MDTIRCAHPKSGIDCHAYSIPLNNSREFSENWENIYGELPAGTYRIGKEIMDFWGTGDYDEKNYYADFTIAPEDTNILSYTDAFEISEYAIPAMQWVCGADILPDADGGSLKPLDQAIRADAAYIIAMLAATQ